MDYMLGQIVAFPFSFVPAGWKLCDGQILQIQQNSALFSLISNQFGGNGTSNFALPDLRGAAPQPGVSYYICIPGIYPTRE